MDKWGHIYKADPEKIPPEDKARLDGYLEARAEEDEKADLEATLREVQAERDALLAKLQAAVQSEKEAR